MAAAQFTVVFNVEESKQTTEWTTYKNFIEGLRPRLGVRRLHDVPVLPRKQNPPSQWFDIVLKTNTHSIKLRIRSDNLYLDAYQMQNSNQWLEFGKEPSPHLIHGSTFLGFGCNYVDLARACDTKIEDIKLGQKALTNAVSELSSATTTASRARNTIIVIQMICESIRFADFSNHFAKTFKGDGSPPDKRMLTLEHKWEDLSKALLRADANPEKFFKLPQPNDMKIVTYLDAIKVLGILLSD